MSTTHPSQETRPEHMFEPDGFPTKILFGMLFALVFALIGTVVLLIQYFESAAQSELAVKVDRENPELMALRAEVDESLDDYGFAACPDTMPAAAAADGEAPAPSVSQCAAEAARFHVPYERALDDFLNSNTALEPGPTPPGVEPIQGAPAGSSGQAVPPAGGQDGAQGMPVRGGAMQRGKQPAGRPARPQLRPGNVRGVPADRRIERAVPPGQRPGGAQPGGAQPGGAQPGGAPN